jgi:hypothetical protein
LSATFVRALQVVAGKENEIKMQHGASPTLGGTAHALRNDKAGPPGATSQQATRDAALYREKTAGNLGTRKRSLVRQSLFFVVRTRIWLMTVAAVLLQAAMVLALGSSSVAFDGAGGRCMYSPDRVSVRAPTCSGEQAAQMSQFSNRACHEERRQ